MHRLCYRCVFLCWCCHCASSYSKILVAYTSIRYEGCYYILEKSPLSSLQEKVRWRMKSPKSQITRHVKLIKVHIIYDHIYHIILYKYIQIRPIKHIRKMDKSTASAKQQIDQIWSTCAQNVPGMLRSS